VSLVKICGMVLWGHSNTGAKVLWLQLGIVSEKARQIAEASGLTVVMNRCMGATHGLLGLGPGPHASTVV